MKNRLIKKFFIILPILLLMTISVYSRTILQVPGIYGSWQKMKKSKLMGNNVVNIDAAKKTLSFMYRGKGFVKLKILSVTKDEKVDMPRFTLKVTGSLGTFKIVIIVSDIKTIYIGHDAVRGLKIWGSYVKK
ncbi:MAG: hypothetical protein KAR07_07145 [Spirochaetes bacterium]|nr:hypothetical protein [Spirochaetota bacterium]MCK5267924.1 hypothetical protein [Spirochaetota bacterium]